MDERSAADPPLSEREKRVYAEAAAEGVEITVRPDSWGLPVVQGHQVSLSEWRAFEAFTMLVGSDADRNKVAARAAGVTVATIRDWRGRDWWDELIDEHVAFRQQDMHVKLLSLQDYAVQGLERVFKAEELPKGLAPAIVAGVSLLTKIGKKPLQDSRNITTINQNSIDNRGGTIVSNRTLDQINDQETMMKVLTGEMKLPEE